MWFKFGEVHSDDLNIKVLRIRKPFLPDFHDQREYVPGKDGSIVYPQPFRELTIEIDCLILYSNRHKKVAEDRNLAKLYSYSEQKLILSDESDVFYIGKLGGTFQSDRHKTLSSFTIEFICQPFSYELEPINQTYTKNSTESFLVKPNGTAYSEFKISITPQSTINNLSIAVNEVILHYVGKVQAGQTLTIDTEEFDAELNDENVSMNLTGEFPVLYPGQNEIKITANTDFNYAANIEYYNRYLS